MSLIIEKNPSIAREVLISIVLGDTSFAGYKRGFTAKMQSPGTPNSASIRLLTDLKQVTEDPPEGCSAAPIDDNDLYVWNATIIGPLDTPWEGGIYSLRLTFSDQYPTKPPKVRFTTEMFHPNIYKDGSLCLDIIQDKWSPIYTVSSILTSIQSLLTDPNVNSPANQDASKLYITNRKLFDRKVRQCAEKSLENATMLG